MEENSKSNVTFNISGGTIQIAPNATMQQQIFYGDQLAEKMLHPEGKASDALTEDEQRLAIYITIALAIWIQEIFLVPEFWFSLRLIIIVNEIKDETSVR